MPLKTISAYLTRFQEINNISDSLSRQKTLNQLWDYLRKRNKIPVVIGDSVLFLYRGEADSVSFTGDFNGWGRNRKLNTRATKLPNLNLWYSVQQFPADARLDYKIVVNRTNWILDPENPNQQWGGSGANSELRMPQWKPEEATLAKKTTKKGNITANLLLQSNFLKYAVQYKVYTPNGYEKMNKLPVLYVTDGHEYADEKLGALVNVLDNLITSKKIKPLIAVFIDPRKPDSLHTNRRMTELPMNEDFADFVAHELVPEIDKNLNTDTSQRAILGTSLGGLFSAYLGYRYSEMFGRVAINSPAFWYREEILKAYQESPKLPLKIYMSTGIMMDTEKHARQMKEIMMDKGYELRYRELNEGHSWGNWRQVAAEMLIYFFGNNDKQP
ncbi:MAG: hypothetical protein H7Y04_12755 [Verrucomicrobia bacterium]|nr:hypothetical protein [Cytophagales bacterium]